MHPDTIDRLERYERRRRWKHRRAMALFAVLVPFVALPYLILIFVLGTVYFSFVLGAFGFIP